MFLINFLSRNSTDEYFPAFECIAIVEIILMICQFIVSLVVCCAIWRSQFHKNLRLRMIFIAIHMNLGSIARIYVIIRHFFGRLEHETSMPIVVCSLIRQAFIGYVCSVMIAIALDRLLASKYWIWYDNGGPTTTLFFVVLELFLLASAYIGYISDVANMSFYGVYMIIGLFAYYIVYRMDTKEIEVLKRGAKINSYSITRSYQLRENINLVKMFSRISIPCACVSAPEFIFYGVFSASGHDGSRLFAIALYDAWMPLIAICAIVSVPLCQPQIAKHMPPRLRYSLYEEKTVVEQRNVRNETDTYFDQLSRNWN